MTFGTLRRCSSSLVTTLHGNTSVQAAGRATMELLVSSGLGVGVVEHKLITPDAMKALSAVTYHILLPLFLATQIMRTITQFGWSKTSFVVPVLAVTHSFLLYSITTQVLFPLFLLHGGRLEEGGSNDDAAAASAAIMNSDDARGVAVCSAFGNGGVVPLIFCQSLFGNQSNRDLLAVGNGIVALFLVGWSPFFWGFGRAILLGEETDHSTTTTPKEILLAKLKTMIPPPVVGVFVGMILATVPFLQALFLHASSSTATTATPILGVVFDTAVNFGKAASPLSLLVLVSSLALGAGFGTQHRSPSPPPRVETGPTTTTAPTTTTDRALSATDASADAIPFWKRWMIVSVMRFVVSPIVMYGLLQVVASPHLGWIEHYKSTKSSLYTQMVWFVCILESCMPPAQNQVTLLHVANKTDKANEMATFLFFVYATAMVPLVLILSSALHQFQLI